MIARIASRLVTSATDGSGSSSLPAPLPEGADWRALNRANWDARVPVHATSRFYDVPGFVGGHSALRDFELAEVGDVSGRTLLHLQCHIGTDTLSWARLGATVTGLDFSGPALETARSIAEQIGATDARFVEADVYDAATALEGRTFDIVYTGLGALCWLPDIERWARTVAELIAPGGCLYLVEFHPVTDMFDEDARTVRFDYFDAQAQVWDNDHTYTDGDKLEAATVTHQFAHTLGSIVSSLIAAGLRLEFLHEFDFTMFPRFAELEQHAGGFSFPAGQPRLPLLYSLRATKANI